MNISRLQQILDILKPYEPDSKWTIFGLHDKVHIGVDPDDLTDEDREKAEELELLVDDTGEAFFFFT